MKKNDSNQNFQIAISLTWKGFQTPSKGLLIKKLPIFSGATTIFENFQNLSSPGQIFREKRIFWGLPVLRFFDQPYFWHPLMVGKNIILFIFSFLDQKNPPPLLCYCVSKG